MVDIDDVVRIGGNHVVADNLHIACQHDKRDVFLLQQFHLGLFHLLLVRMVFLDAPHIVGDAELIGHIVQIFVVRHNAWDVTVEFSCLPAGQ